MNDPAQTDLSQFHEAKQDNANKPAGVGGVGGGGVDQWDKLDSITAWKENNTNEALCEFNPASLFSERCTREVNVLSEWSLKDKQHSRFVISHSGQTPCGRS